MKPLFRKCCYFCFKWKWFWNITECLIALDDSYGGYPACYCKDCEDRYKANQDYWYKRWEAKYNRNIPIRREDGKIWTKEGWVNE